MRKACAKFAQDAEFARLRQLLFNAEEFGLDHLAFAMGVLEHRQTLLEYSYPAVQSVFIVHKVDRFHLTQIRTELGYGMNVMTQGMGAVATHPTDRGMEGDDFIRI